MRERGSIPQIYTSPIRGWEFLNPLEAIFERVDAEPLAAASLARVHRARFRGDEVVVKLLRPGVLHRLNLDLAMMTIEEVEEKLSVDLPDLIESYSGLLTELPALVRRWLTEREGGAWQAKKRGWCSHQDLLLLFESVPTDIPKSAGEVCE